MIHVFSLQSHVKDHVFLVTPKLCDFTDTSELESLDRMHKSVITD